MGHVNESAARFASTFSPNFPSIAMPTEPLIDTEAIENLRALSPDDGDGFLRDIVGIFLEDTPLRIAELHQSLTASDQIKFTRAAHSLKGSSSNLGANSLRTIAEELEKRSRSEGLTGLGLRVADLEQAFAATKAELEKIVAPA